MRINELPLIADFSATDYAGVDNGTATRKINLAGIINGIKTNKVDKSDALLNLDTTQAATTTDGALYAAIDGLGWGAVISNQLMDLKALLTQLVNNQKRLIYGSFLIDKTVYTKMLYSVAVRRIGNIASLPINGFTGLTANAWTNICTLPEKFRPSGSAVDIALPLQAGNGTTAVLLELSTTGVMRVYNYTSNTGNISVATVVTYICNGDM